VRKRKEREGKIEKSGGKSEKREKRERENKILNFRGNYTVGP